MSNQNHTSNDFVVKNEKEKLNSNYHFFYGWDADGAPVEEYPENIFIIKVNSNDSTK